MLTARMAQQTSRAKLQEIFGDGPRPQPETTPKGTMYK